MKYCPFCGEAFTGDGTSFCSECGKAAVMPARPQRAPQTQNKKRQAKNGPPPVRPGPGKRNGQEISRRRRRNPMDEGYDGYYDDVPTSDSGRQPGERFEPELAKRIILVAGGFLAVVILSVVIMVLL